MSALVRSYARVAIAGWSCLTAAGDTRTSWQAASSRRCVLMQSPGIGWCGRVANVTTMAELSLQAALPAWRAIAEKTGFLALAAASSKGDPDAWERALNGDAQALFAALPHAPGAHLARQLKLGVHLPTAVTAACSTGLASILAAADALEDGRATHALAGAADRSLTPLLIAGYRALRVLCDDQPPQAFGDPTGFAPAEGAGYVALANDGPWRLVAGVRAADAGHETHFTDPATLRAALAGLWSVCPDPDLIVTHGTGTALGDAYETAGLLGGPWRYAMRLHAKPTLGHTLGASSAVELALALEAPVRRLWKLSLGFGGHLAAVAVIRS